VSSIQYVRLYADSAGESHMQTDLKIELTSMDFVPPAPPIEVSTIESATTYGFLCVPRGYNGDWHPSPKRQWIFFLAGEMEFEVANGQVHRSGPGSAMLLEDTSGRGHRSRVVSDTAAVLAAVQL
jgi:quercetin dioxygenase-like cupin family protein